MIWSVLNVLMFLVTVPGFTTARQLVELVLVMDFLLLWLVINVVGFIIIHYTAGPSIIEEFSDTESIKGRGDGRVVLPRKPAHHTPPLMFYNDPEKQHFNT